MMTKENIKAIAKRIPVCAMTAGLTVAIFDALKHKDNIDEIENLRQQLKEAQEEIERLKREVEKERYFADTYKWMLDEELKEDEDA